MFFKRRTTISEYSVIDLALEDAQCILEALKEMGYNPTIVETAKKLYGYQGDQRKQKAHIIIPRSQVGSASNDVGFEKVDGKYIMHLSEYDKHIFNQKKFKQLYNKSKITKAVKKNSKLSIKSTQVKKDGSIAIRIRVASY